MKCSFYKHFFWKVLSEKNVCWSNPSSLNRIVGVKFILFQFIPFLKHNVFQLTKINFGLLSFAEIMQNKINITLSNLLTSISIGRCKIVHHALSFSEGTFSGTPAFFRYMIKNNIRICWAVFILRPNVR